MDGEIRAIYIYIRTKRKAEAGVILFLKHRHNI
jgi:hypothetical protein